MSNVEFEENNFPGNRFVEASKSPVMVKFILQTGLVKDEKQANYVLIGVAVCAFLLTLYVIKDMFGGPANQNIIVPSNILQNQAIPDSADDI